MAGHVAYLALGSNLGDRAGTIRAALQRVEEFAAVDETSFLYETAPAYVTDQPVFLNAACRVGTELGPLELLAALKQVENDLGRTESVRYGPRVVDIDILFYDEIVFETSELRIPHPQLAERDFVLGPLLDMAPELMHPVLGRNIRQLWQDLGAQPLTKVMPVGGQIWRWGEKTRVMGIINATDDSFSGDGVMTGDAAIARAVAQAEQMAAAGADVLDVGGHSTRPGHALQPEAVELARVVPVIEALANAVDVPLSVDTFRSAVAEAALAAGAHMINDVWGMRYDRSVGSVAARHGAPLIVMDNRMQPEDGYYRTRVGDAQGGTGDLLGDIHAELSNLLVRAQESGVPRWLLIADPGIGFGKGVAGNLTILRRLDRLARLGYPILCGPSRKGFIGTLLGGLPPTERTEGTIAACVLATERGAEIVRVHDVEAVARALLVADGILHPSITD
jgi:dihydropteroate synthase/2-amino-4-hydroxy-6-hydroxymethyldihydropteridine diphosphokinase